MNKFSLYFFIALLIIVPSGITTQGNLPISSIKVTPAKTLTEMPNVIMLIGDGMGPEAVKLASLVEYGQEFGSIMDTFPTKQEYTTRTINGVTTDSAAGATALATGQLTNYNTNGMDETRTIPYKTILEYLLYDFGYATGLVSNLQSYHATPAGFASHTEDREDKVEIVAQMLPKLDVLLGSGLGNTLLGPENTARTKGESHGYEVVVDRDELLATYPTADKLLGVFPGGSRLEYEAERDPTIEPSLAEMSTAAIDVLNRREKPYFLMIEGGLIDYAGHKYEPNFENKTYFSASETIMFEKTVRIAHEFAEKDGNTIVIVGADHETGGLTIHDFTDLDSTLPSPDNSREENQAIRLTRANQVNATWFWNAHTDNPVKFFGYGSDFGNHNISTNIEVFWALNKALGSFPTVLRTIYTPDGNFLNITTQIKDQDQTADKFEVVIEYNNGTTKIFQFALDDVEVKLYDVRVAIDSGQQYKAYVKVLDGGLNDVTSFDNNNKLVKQNVVYTTIESTTSSSTTSTSTSIVASTSTSSEKSNNDDSPISFSLLGITSLIVVLKSARRKRDCPV